MKKKTGMLIAVAVVGIVLVWFVGAYNGLVGLEENVETTWSQVENVYQRRADLVPQLVSVVKGSAAHESGTLAEVVEARAKATQLKIDPSTATEEQLAAYANAQDGLGQALGRLMVLQESYPDLKANKNFETLMAQVEGTENRCEVARKAYIEQVKEYNKAVRQFPRNIVASLFGFERRANFVADEGTDTAPDVTL